MPLYAVASSPWVHDDSCRGSSERSLDSPKSQCSMGFLPVFFRTIEQRVANYAAIFRDVYKNQG
jgi:hypothetical protein